MKESKISLLLFHSVESLTYESCKYLSNFKIKVKITDIDLTFLTGVKHKLNHLKKHLSD